MKTSTFYQDLGAKTGYISSPVNLEEKAMMLNQPNIDAAKAYNHNYQDTLKNQVTNTSYSPSLQPAAQLNRDYQYGNGNPIFQRGATTLQNGSDTFDVPNAIAQQLAYEQGVNGGRVNVLDKYLGGNNQQGMPYSSNAVRQDYLKTIGENPIFQGTGAVSPMQARNQEINNIKSQYTSLPDLNHATEKLDTFGQGFKGLTANQQIDQQTAALPQVNSRRAYGQEQDSMRQIGEMLSQLQTKQPTYSNLPIKETVVK